MTSNMFKRLDSNASNMFKRLGNQANNLIQRAKSSAPGIIEAVRIGARKAGNTLNQIGNDRLAQAFLPQISALSRQLGEGLKQGSNYLTKTKPVINNQLGIE